VQDKRELANSALMDACMRAMNGGATTTAIHAMAVLTALCQSRPGAEAADNWLWPHPTHDRYMLALVKIICFSKLLQGNMTEAVAKAIRAPATRVAAMQFGETLALVGFDASVLRADATKAVMTLSNVVGKPAFECVKQDDDDDAAGAAFGFLARLLRSPWAREYVLNAPDLAVVKNRCLRQLETGRGALAAKACEFARAMFVRGGDAAFDEAVFRLVGGLIQRDGRGVGAQAALAMLLELAALHSGTDARLVAAPGLLAAMTVVAQSAGKGVEGNDAKRLRACFELFAALALTPGEANKTAVARSVAPLLPQAIDDVAAAPKLLEPLVSAVLFLYTTPEARAVLQGAVADWSALVNRIRAHHQGELTAVAALRMAMVAAEDARLKGRDVGVAIEVREDEPLFRTAAEAVIVAPG